jgi:CDP-diacylglycerol--serine O-phosphatidyltransferase
MKRKLGLEDRKARRMFRRRIPTQRSRFALPSSITLISVLCGFSSVVMSINATGLSDKHSFLWAASLIILAAVFDGLDGRVARATNTTSEFGVQLDSLADMVSFGMAPAILAYRYGFLEIGHESPQARAIGWAASFFFLACGALRLARFNVQVGKSDPRFFMGMPIPLGAVCVASVILKWPESISSAGMAYAFASGLFVVGLLMVSSLGFPSLKERSHHPRATMWITVSFLFLLCLLVILRSAFFLGFLAVYALVALTLNLGWHLGWEGIRPPRAAEAEEGNDEEPRTK